MTQASPGNPAVDVQIDYDPHINYAMHQNDVPVVKQVRIVSRSSEPLDNLTLFIQIESGISGLWQQPIARIAPGETLTISRVDLPLDPNVLARQLEREKTRLVVRLTTTAERAAESPDAAGAAQPDALFEQTYPIDVLAFNEWAGIGSLPEIMAALVMPNHPFVSTLLQAARQHLQQHTQSASISGYQSRSRARVLEIVRAIYAAIGSAGIGYISHAASYEKHGQKVRLPDQIANEKFGNCFDLTLLMAACAEQAGLHALVILTRGHAHLGVWLDDQSFPDPATDEPLRIRKRVDLDEIVVIESVAAAASPPLAFDEAQKAARRHLEDPDQFITAVDIHCCRNLSIRPLPMRLADGSVSLADDAHFASAAPLDNIASPDEPDMTSPDDLLLPDDEDDYSPAPAPATDTRLDRWKRKLLDLSLRNRVLNFRETKKSIPLVCPDVTALEDALADGHTFTVMPKPPLLDDQQPRDAALIAERTHEDALDTFLKRELASRRVYSSLTEAELDKRLLETYRAARSAFEESGATTLYLAIGFLVWYETPQSDSPRLAPILLVPVELERPSVRGSYRLSQTDEDPRINVTLIEKLRTEFGLDASGLDEMTADESGLDVRAILKRFKQLIRDIDRWDVIEEATLGLFSFTKFLMWRDLQDRADTLMTNRVVRHLVDRPNEPFEKDVTFPDPHTLDSDRPPADTLYPRNADSSQAAAIFAAHDGHSFVLEGPPGTGKSQTITNLIAHCLGHGKRVLFVSEKMAALKVVHRRLSEVGLDPFCLELHSHQASKREVLRQLEHTFEVARLRSPESWQQQCEALGASRTKLNDYVHAVHRNRTIGLSVFEATSRLIALRDAPAVDLPIGDIDNLEAAAFATMRAQVDAMMRAADTVKSYATHPLRAIGRGRWETALPDKISAAAREMQHVCSSMAGARDALLKAMNISCETPASQAQLEWLRLLIRLLAQPHRPTQAMLAEPDWQAMRTQLEALITRGRARDAFRRELFNKYDATVLDEDLRMTRAALLRAGEQWFVVAWFIARPAKKTLALHYKAGSLPDNKHLVTDVEKLIELKTETDAVSKSAPLAQSAFGISWQQGEADWDKLTDIINWAHEFRRLLAHPAAAALNSDGSLKQRLLNVAVDERDQCEPSGRVGQQFSSYNAAHSELLTRLTSLHDLIETDRTFWPGKDDPDFLSAVATTAQSWIDNIDLLNDWCYWRRTEHEAAPTLQPLIAAWSAGTLATRDWPAAFERAVLQQWLSRIVDSEPLLQQFNRVEHEHRIEKFRELDTNHLKLCAQYVNAKLAADVPHISGDAVASSEVGILQRQARLKRRHMPVRKLIAALPNLLPRLKPCMLMSPLSVAQYLDTSFPPFDVIVFDEASQIPVWDAVGAIARGSEAIVVGDSKQLPPTSFFAKLTENEFQDENDFEELESILDECAASGIPSLRLLWHYRSRHESLIAFSNQHYYENRLNTFPSAENSSEVLGVSMRFIEDGQYDRGRSCTNPIEAQSVVDEVLRRLADPLLQHKSIGIVTFSMAQQILIEDMLDKARGERPEIETFFSNDQLEPLFIKNLENVQGDERAAILFSVCYGPDNTGRVSMNFGPLNREGGQRRLNVAITRAREQVVVFSSMKCEHIDLSRSNREGVRHLKAFLDYAERGSAALSAAPAGNDGRDETSLEREIEAAVTGFGYEVDYHVGCSGYRINLAVRDPDTPGRYLLGIECDGRFYRSAPTARDRDRIRQSVLENLGWSLHRIWSSDWLANPTREAERLRTAIESALALTRSQDESRPALSSPDDQAPAATADASNEEAASKPTSAKRAQTPTLEGQAVYKTAIARKPAGTAEDFYDDARRSKVSQSLMKIIETEAPIHFDLATNRLMSHWQLTRQTSKVTGFVQQLIDELAASGRVTQIGPFIWLPDQEPATYAHFRVPDDSSPIDARQPEDVPAEEYAVAMAAILKQMISLPDSDLHRETGRLFGFARLTPRTQPIIAEGLTLLVDRGSCRIDETDGQSMVVLPR